MEDTSTGAASRASIKEVFALATVLIALVAAFLGKALVGGHQLLAGHDARALFYPWLSIAREAVHDGRLPLWDPSVFSGVPFLANPQVAFWYPPTWLAFVLPVTTALSVHAALHLLIAGTGMAVLVRELHRDNAAALLAALTFTFSAFMGARLYGGHLGVIAVYAWVPWLLAATHRAARDGGAASAIVAGVPLALAVLAGHVTSLLYVAIVWGGFGLALAGREHGFFRVGRQMAVSTAVGFALAAVQVVPFIELARHSSRLSADVSDFIYAMPIRHLVTLVVPDFFGDPVRASYWSTPNFEEYFYAVGLLPLLCLPLAAFIRAPWSRYCVLLMAAGVALAPGALSPVYHVMSAVLPLPLDRVPARALVLFTFGASLLLGGLTAEARRGYRPARARRMVVITAGAIAIGALLAIVFKAAAVQDAPTESVRAVREIRLLALVRVAAMSFLLSAAWSWMLRRHDWVPVAVLSGLVVVDLWSFSWRLIDVRPVEPAPVWRDAAALIADRDVRVAPWRIPLLDENDGMLVGLRSTGGYNTLALAPYHSLLEDADVGGAAYDVAAAGYVISETAIDLPADDDRTLEPAGQLGAAWVYRRPHALAMVRLVYQIEVIGAAPQARARLDEPAFDPGRTAILADAAGCRPGPPPAEAGHAEVLNAAPGHWEISTRSDAPGVLVLAENAYPGWEVTVDGVAAAPLVAYSTFNAVCVPPGEHRIVWHFRSRSLMIGAGVSFGALLIAVSFLLADRHAVALARGCARRLRSGFNRRR